MAHKGGPAALTTSGSSRIATVTLAECTTVTLVRVGKGNAIKPIDIAKKVSCDGDTVKVEQSRNKQCGLAVNAASVDSKVHKETEKINTKSKEKAVVTNNVYEEVIVPETFMTMTNSLTTVMTAISGISIVSPGIASGTTCLPVVSVVGGGVDLTVSLIGTLEVSANMVLGTVMLRALAAVHNHPINCTDKSIHVTDETGHITVYIHEDKYLEERLDPFMTNYQNTLATGKPKTKKLDARTDTIFTLDATASSSIPPTPILIPAKNELAKANQLQLALETKALEQEASNTAANNQGKAPTGTDNQNDSTVATIVTNDCRNSGSILLETMVPQVLVQRGALTMSSKGHSSSFIEKTIEATILVQVGTFPDLTDGGKLEPQSRAIEVTNVNDDTKTVTKVDVDMLHENTCKATLESQDTNENRHHSTILSKLSLDEQLATVKKDISKQKKTNACADPMLTADTTTSSTMPPTSRMLSVKLQMTESSTFSNDKNSIDQDKLAIKVLHITITHAVGDNKTPHAEGAFDHDNVDRSKEIIRGKKGTCEASSIYSIEDNMQFASQTIKVAAESDREKEEKNSFDLTHSKCSLVSKKGESFNEKTQMTMTTTKVIDNVIHQNATDVSDETQSRHTGKHASDQANDDDKDSSSKKGVKQLLYIVGQSTTNAQNRQYTGDKTDSTLGVRIDTTPAG